MSFDCRDLLAREAIRVPPVAEKQMNRLINPWWIYKESKIASSNNSGTGIFSQLAEYTTLKLTYQSDVLSAMLGILQIYATLEGNPVYHVCGVPILLRPVYRSLKRRRFPVINEDEGDSETTEVALAGFFSGLCWTLRSPGVRRPGFPNWSWTRWHGEVEDRFRGPYRGEFNVGFNVEASIVVADGIAPMPWSDYYGRLSNSVVKEGRSNTVFAQDHMLEITVYIITARFYEKKDFWHSCLEWKGTVGSRDEVCEGDFALTPKGSSSSLGDNEVGFVPSLRRRLLEES